MSYFLGFAVLVTGCVIVLVGVFLTAAVLMTGGIGAALPDAAQRRLAGLSGLLRRAAGRVGVHLSGDTGGRVGDTTAVMSPHRRQVQMGAPTLARPGAVPPAPTRRYTAAPEQHRRPGSDQGPGPAAQGGGGRGLEFGDQFGPYRLHALIGQGGMGQVWRAFDTRRRRWVALKVLPEELPIPARARERMQREAELAGSLSSAHVIPVHDFGQIRGITFLDMRLVPGGDLAGLLREHPDGLGPGRSAQIVAQIADALDAAHTAGLVHCDVKPSNVLLDTTAAGDFCYLADFGLATLAHTTAASPSNTICGTPTYMAPELFTSSDAATAASDIYALGVLAQELLTGRSPFHDPSVGVLYRQHTHQPPPAPSATDPALAALDPVLARALHKTPEQRYRSAGALAAALTDAVATLTGPVLTEATPAGPALGGADPAGVDGPPAPERRPRPEDSLDIVFTPPGLARSNKVLARSPRAA